MIIDTHVHVFTDDRKNYPQIRDTPRAGAIPTVTEIGQTEWPLTTTEQLIKMMDEAGVDKATLVQAYFVYEYDNSYAVDSVLKYRSRFSSVVVLDPMDPKSPDTLTRLVEQKGVTGIRFMRGRLPECSLGRPETYPLWARIEQHKLPLAINERIAEYGGIRAPMEKYPGARVAFEHSWGHTVGAPPGYRVLQPLFDLAENPNVFIKTAINNIAAARDGGGTPEQLYEKLVQVFGARRIMWSSNYPAHPKFGGIKQRLEQSKKAISFLGQEEQEWILGKTALDFYPCLKPK